jgi:hypothetical protein
VRAGEFTAKTLTRHLDGFLMRVVHFLSPS